MSFVDTVAGHPAVYNLLQDLAGRRKIQRRLQPWLDQISGRVVDVGGGTGRYAERLSRSVHYVCVDLEPQKIRHIQSGEQRRNGLVGEAASLPFGARTFDSALLIGVIHHLSEPLLRTVIQEIARVLVPSGRFVMLDAVAAPHRLTSRALWSWDRGNHPRTPEMLDAVLREFFHVDDTATFDVLHEYFAMNCRAPAEGGTLPPRPERTPVVIGAPAQVNA